MKTAYFNRFEISLSDDCVEACSHSGSCDADVDFWFNKITIDASDKDIRAELKEYGAWDDEELKDNILNRKRILWLAAGNINDDK